MRISKLLFTCMCWLLGVAAVWGQAANSQSANGQGKPGILGHYDPQTRIFRPLPQARDSAVEPLVLTTFTGTINVTFTITLKSSSISNPACIVFMDVQDAATTSSLRRLTEIGIVASTGSGSTRTCTVSIPYSWGLATQSSDMMQTSYEITALPLGAAKPPDRTSILIRLDNRKVPANGTITTLTASVTQ